MKVVVFFRLVCPPPLPLCLLAFFFALRFFKCCVDCLSSFGWLDGCFLWLDSRM